MVKCNLFLTVKLNFQPSSLQSSVSHDLSEIILKCCYSTYFPISKFFSCLSQKFLARTNCNVDQSVCWQSSLATQEQDFPYPRFALMFFILLLNPWIYRSTSFSPHVSALNHLPQTCSFLSFCITLALILALVFSLMVLHSSDRCMWQQRCFEDYGKES